MRNLKRLRKTGNYLIFLRMAEKQIGNIGNRGMVRFIYSSGEILVSADDIKTQIKHCKDRIRKGLK